MKITHDYVCRFFERGVERNSNKILLKHCTSSHALSYNLHIKPILRVKGALSSICNCVLRNVSQVPLHQLSFISNMHFSANMCLSVFGV